MNKTSNSITRKKLKMDIQSTFLLGVTLKGSLAMGKIR